MRLPALPGILAMLCFLNSSSAQSTVTLELAEPQWSFSSDFVPLQNRDSALLPEEQDIAAQLRPLVSNADYRGALKLLEEHTEPFSAALRYVQAQLYLAAGQAKQARDTYLKVLEAMPDFQRAHRGLAAVYLQLEENLKAREHLVRAIELGAWDAQIFGQLAYINLKQGNAWSAVGAYQQALFLQADSEQWRQGLIIALMRTRQYEPARALLEESLAETGDDADLWLQHSRLSLDTDDTTGALASLEIASSLSELSPANTLMAAQLHLREGSLRRGLSLLKGGLQAFDQDQLSVLLQTLEWLSRQGETEATEQLAAAMLDGSLKLDAVQRSSVLGARGRARVSIGQLKKGKADLEQALKLDPSSGESLLSLAAVESDNKPYRASTLYERAASLEDFAERANLGYAQLLIEQGNYARALECLRNARQLNPHLPGLANNIRSLERLLTLGPD